MLVLTQKFFIVLLHDCVDNMGNNDIMVVSAGYYSQKHIYTDRGQRMLQKTDTAAQTGNNGGNIKLLYVHEDIMGNTRYHSKDNGQSYAELEYDVWGNPTSHGMLLNNDNGVFIIARFTGHQYDTVIDVYFAQARFYDAKNRQWLSSDPMKDGLNWYQYVGSNPATWVDPWGLFRESTILKKGDGGSFANQETKDDIYAIQMRLITLGFLSTSKVTFGKFDSHTEKAVETFIGTTTITTVTNKVNAEVYRALGFTISDGTVYIGQNPFSTDEYQIGVAYARYLMDQLLFSIQSELLTLKRLRGPHTVTEYHTAWQYISFTRGYEYFMRITCLTDGKKGWENVNFLADIANQAIGSYKQATEVVPVQHPFILGGTTVVLFFYNYFSPEPGYKDVIDSLIGAIYDPKIEKARQDFAELYETELYYVLSDKSLSPAEKGKLSRKYINDLSSIVQAVRTEKGTSNQFDAKKARQWTISYIESVISHTMKY